MLAFFQILAFGLSMLVFERTTRVSELVWSAEPCPLHYIQGPPRRVHNVVWNLDPYHRPHRSVSLGVGCAFVSPLGGGDVGGAGCNSTALVVYQSQQTESPTPVGLGLVLGFSLAAIVCFVAGLAIHRRRLALIPAPIVQELFIGPTIPGAWLDRHNSLVAQLAASEQRAAVLSATLAAKSSRLAIKRLRIRELAAVNLRLRRDRKPLAVRAQALQKRVAQLESAADYMKATYTVALALAEPDVLLIGQQADARYEEHLRVIDGRARAPEAARFKLSSRKFDVEAQATAVQTQPREPGWWRKKKPVVVGSGRA